VTAKDKTTIPPEYAVAVPVIEKGIPETAAEYTLVEGLPAALETVIADPTKFIRSTVFG
jgi:hypothetical protein